MIKKTFIFGALALAMVAMMPSCGKGKSDDSSDKEKTVLEPKELQVKALSESEGTLAKNISLKEGTYTINFEPEKYVDKYEGKVVITVDATKLPGYNDKMYMSSESYKLVFLDQNDAPIEEGFSASTSDMDLLLKEGGTKSISFRSSYLEPEKVEDLISKAKSIKLTASGTLKKKDDSSSSSSSSSSSGGYGSMSDDDDSDDDEGSTASSSSSSSSEWDSLLDDYDSYVSSMADYIKKASKGDPTALAEYASAQADALSLYEKMNKAKGEMTSAQVSRLNKILAKYNKALQQMR